MYQNQETLLAILIVIVDDQRVRPMYDADAPDSKKHLVDFGVRKPERATTLNDFDDLLRQ